MAQTSQSGWDADLLRIVMKLYGRKDSELFRDPVPHEELGLVDYLDVVKKPMALVNVRSRLEGKGDKYRNMEECAFDIRLIWRNAIVYNSPGSKVFVVAQALSELWESLYAEVAPNDQDKPPSAQDMRRFAEKCHYLTTEELGGLLQKLDKDCSMCLIKRADINECEVNVDLMTGSVFRAAMEYVNKCIPEEAPADKEKEKKKRPREESGGSAGGGGNGAGKK